MYRQLRDFQGEVSQTTIQRVSDGACIPCVDDNRDYQDYLKWVAEGNTILPPAE